MPARLDGDERNWLLLRKDAERPAAGDLRPQLATLTETLPTGTGWLYEPKWDGYRAIVAVRGGEATLTSRNGNDLTERFREIARAVVHAVRSPSAVIDGEVCALDDAGAARFETLQSGSGRLVLIAFDLLELDDRPVVGAAAHGAATDARGAARPDRRGGPVVAGVRRRRRAPRRGERAGPRGRRGEARGRPVPPRPAHAGVAEAEAARAGRLPDRRVHARIGPAGEARRARSRPCARRTGSTGRGTSARGSGTTSWTGSLGLLRPLERATSPLARTPKMPRVRAADLTWVEPVLAAEVTYAERTREGRLRAPVYLGVRDDVPVERAPIEPEITRGRRTLRLSNLDKPSGPTRGSPRESFSPTTATSPLCSSRTCAGGRSR